MFECLAVAHLLGRVGFPGPACSGLPGSVLSIGLAGLLSWSRPPRSCPNRFALDSLSPAEQSCSIVNSSHVSLFCSFLCFSCNFVNSLSLISPAASLHLMILLVVPLHCGQLLLSCLGGFQLCFQHASLLDKSPDVLTNPRLPLSFSFPRTSSHVDEYVSLIFLHSCSISSSGYSSSTGSLNRASYLLVSAMTNSFLIVWSLNLLVQYFFLEELGFLRLTVSS